MVDNFKRAYESSRKDLIHASKTFFDMHKQIKTFYLLRKDVQNTVIQEMLNHCSETQELLRQVMNEDINIHTIKQFNEREDDNEEQEEETFTEDELY